MKRLVIFCEGAAEQEFCERLLRPHLFPKHDGKLHSIEIVHSKHHGKVSRGGVPAHYETMRRGILNDLKRLKGPEISFTSMIDLYALPNDFPGKQENLRNPANPVPYVEALEKAFGDDIGDLRFVP